MSLAGLLLGASMAWFAITRILWLAMILAAVSGYGTIILFAAANTMLQAIVEDRMRGRLMAFYIMAVMGTAPLGSLAAGWIATPQRLGETRTVAIAGALSVGRGPALHASASDDPQIGSADLRPEGNHHPRSRPGLAAGGRCDGGSCQMKVGMRG
jgi:MFS family permease